MTDQPTWNPGRSEAGRYEIRIKGRLDAHWAAWFDGLSISQDSDGTTVISGPVADQAALHGVIQRVRDLGLPLVSVTRLSPDGPDQPEIMDSAAGSKPPMNNSERTL
jgi:hypothetical protein